jgi:hypothetical protein
VTTGTAPGAFARSLLRTKPVDRTVAEGGHGGVTWTVFAIWIAVGLAAYFPYGRRHPRLAARSTGQGGEPA